ncbi:hypothetical protein [Streptomyces sp. NPDC007369]|uniref:hypothetical protein n=1 Tax=Streptomyces sp. NPDC007369 TaxID=3154589 RepID=UPI0033C211A9
MSRAARTRIRFHGDAVLRDVRQAAARGLQLGAEHLLAEARKEVPIAEGTLERSGTATVDEAELVAGVAFDTPYAKRVHEDLSARHSPGRKAKFLEDPANREAGVISELIAAQVRRALRG